MNFVGRQCLKIFKTEVTNKSCIHGLGRTLSYKSAYSLENLYPKSNLNLYTPKFVPEDPNSQFTGYIPIKEMQITYSSSSGPGGQNVNRVNTKVDLRFHVKSATWINDDLKEKILQKYYNKINKDGYLIVKSDQTRSQQLNLADALQKLRQMIRDLIVIPAEPSELTKMKHQKNQLRAARERVFTKRIKSQIKKDRRGPGIDD